MLANNNYRAGNTDISFKEHLEKNTIKTLQKELKIHAEFLKYE